MAGGGTEAGDEAQDLGLVQLDGLGGSQIVRSQQNGNIGIDAALNDTAEDAQNAGADVLNVGSTTLHISIVHGGEHIGKLSGDLVNGILSVVAVVDHALDGLFVVQILSHHLVSLEQESSLIAGFDTGLLSQLTQLIDGHGLCALEAQPLGVGIFNSVVGNLGLGAAVEIQRAHANAGRDALALNGDHCVTLLFVLSEALKKSARSVGRHRLPTAAE